MSKKQVSYTFCPEYELNEVREAIEKIFSSFPDLEDKFRPQTPVNVLLKPNLLAARHPDKAITTHPVVLKAVIDYLKQFNCNITIADSPAGVYNDKALEKLYKACQIDTIARETGCSLNFDASDQVINLPEGKVLKKCLMIKPAVEADFIINIAKLKTHTLTRLTCATKNLFGIMPGVLKYRQHIVMPDLKVFSQMLLDINKHFEHKVFHIVDGIIGMEGEGPGSKGEPKFAGALFGGWDSGSVDILACHIMGMPVNTVPTLANYKGLEDINILAFDEIRTHNFKLPPVRYKSLPDYIPDWVQNILMELMVAKPLIDSKTCKKCNICIEACPAEIIEAGDKGVCISDYKNCIKCYCCQEACPHGAINLSQPLIERIFRFFRKINKKS
ncbi:MAG: hypothetical protein A2104_00365 [Candidatus Melainabacteria bacterium GWF2_32_7]|nr:MAG: hypothetical protein A2104_00365 [Candidatus Melainabacteria bacterium GWF2_32_7]